MKKSIFALSAIVLISPSIALASWWNPFTWFHKKAPQPQTPQVEVLKMPTVADVAKTSKTTPEKEKTTVVRKNNPTIPAKKTEEIKQTSQRIGAEQSQATNKVIILSSGAVIEVDDKGNFIRIIQSAPQEKTQIPVFSNPTQSPRVDETPAPIYTIESKYTLNAPDYVFFVENALNGNFDHIAITYKVPTKRSQQDTRQDTMTWEGSSKLAECTDIKHIWLETAGVSYPYPCPDSTSDYYYFTKYNVDNFGRSTPFDMSPISSSNPGVTFVTGSEVYYYKVIEKKTGKVFEYQK